MSKSHDFFFLFGLVFESRFGPILIPKLVQNLLIFGSILDPFFLGFRSSLGGLKSEKMQTVSRENHFFENVAFFGLWSSGPKMAPKMVPKRDPKSDKKMVHKIIPKMVQTVTNKWSTTWQKIAPTETSWAWGPSKKLVTSKMFPKWLQDCPR